MLQKILVVYFLSLAVMPEVSLSLKFSTTTLTMLVNETTNLQLILGEFPVNKTFTMEFIVEHPDVLKVSPIFLTKEDLYDLGTGMHTIEITSLIPGESEIFTNTSILGTEEALVQVHIYKNFSIEILSLIMGWGYFIAWSFSFYPQIYENYKRKSVVGLNFDYLVTNLTGYLCYAAFNLGLYYIPAIQEQYSQRYPRSIISVLRNDIFFSVHAIILTVYTCFQCLIYDRGDQKVSWFGKAFHYVFGVLLLISVGLTIGDVIQWLDFLYICSYVKLVLTACKYVPQALFNYQRKSTDGWSIGNVLLDVAGGILSILQMMLNGYNYDKWKWILENPTKLGLGIVTLFFDIIFMVQHYCLYHDDDPKKKRRRQTHLDIIEAEEKILEKAV